MTLEQRVDALERRVSRYRGATIVMAFLLVAGVTMGQGTRDAEFGTVRCRKLVAISPEKSMVMLEANESGGTVILNSPEGKSTVILSVDDEKGFVGLNSPEGKSTVILSVDDESGGTVMLGSPPEGMMVMLGADESGGTVTTFSPKGKSLVKLGGSRDGVGGVIAVSNKTGETVVQMHADEYGNGLVGAYNRKGKGRTLQPGP